METRVKEPLIKNVKSNQDDVIISSDRFTDVAGQCLGGQYRDVLLLSCVLTLS